MSAYVRLVESLLVEMGQKGRYKERQATKLRQQDAEAAAGARNPTPLDPIPSPVDRSGPGGASGGTDELGNAIKTNAQKDAEKAKADAEKEAEKEEKPEISPEQARKADALKATGRGRGRQLGRVVRGAGDKYSLARSLSRRYARSVDPGSRDKIDKVRNFRRGVDAIGKGTMAGVKKFLKTGKNLPSGGQSLV